MFRMFNRYFIIAVAFIGALIACLASGSHVLANDLDEMNPSYRVVEASDDSAEGEEDSEFC